MTTDTDNPTAYGPTASGEGPVLVWDPDRHRVVTANPAGLALFGAASLEDLQARPFGADEPPRPLFGEVAGLLRPQGHVQETFVLPGGHGPLQVTAALSCTPLPDGRHGLLVRVLSVEPAQIHLSDLMLDVLDLPLALAHSDGTLVAANARFRADYWHEPRASLFDLVEDEYACAEMIGRVLGFGSGLGVCALRTRFGVRRHRVTVRRLADPRDGRALLCFLFDDIQDRQAVPDRAAQPEIAPVATSAPEPEPEPEPAPAPVPDAGAWLAALPLAACLIAPSGEIIAANQGAGALFGFTAAGRSLIDLVDPALAPDLAEALADSPGGAGPRELPANLMTAGDPVPVRLRLSPLGPSGLVLALLDAATAPSADLAALRAERDAARAESARKAQVIASVSHELRTPLNAVLGFATIMEEMRFGPLGHPRYHEYARDIVTSARHMLGLVNELLDLAKAQAGRLELAFDSVDVAETALQALRMAEPMAQSRGIRLAAALPAGLPRVVADRRTLLQILLNLLANAVAHTREGGAVEVAAGVSEAGDLHILVADTGPGMTPEQLAAAFEPFRSGRRDGKGTGLGLPLAKALADANRSELSVTSAPDTGTVARIVFPGPSVLAD